MIRYFLAIALSIFCMSCEVKPKSKPQPNVTLTWERIKNQYQQNEVKEGAEWQTEFISQRSGVKFEKLFVK